jgi:hypothetical protein
VCLTDVHLIEGHASDRHMSYGRIPYRRVSYGRALQRACISWVGVLLTSLPCAQVTGGEDPYIDNKDVLKLLNCGRLGRQAAGHPWSALRVVKSCRKDCLTASVLLEAKAAALHPERYQSSLSKLSTERGRAWRGKEAQLIGLASQSDRQKVMDRQVIDRQVEDRQTDRQDETRSMSAGTQADRAAS